jgi:CDP-diacylglycerol--glycerol-3-phosphate 3-phosphatidyltransferase
VREVDGCCKHVVSGLAATGLTPNMFTFLRPRREFVGGRAVRLWGDSDRPQQFCFSRAFSIWLTGRWRAAWGASPHSARFLDSTLDRYSDLALYMGLVVYYTLAGRPFYMTLAAVAMASSFMVSYSRARAESLIPSCKVGFMERPERLVLLIMGGVFNRMAQVLWVIATISTITVIHRVVYTWQELRAGRSLPEARPQSTQAP